MRNGSPILITGGAGFIGTNLADHFARKGHRVLIYDNFSRPGVEKNFDWLKRTHPGRVTLVQEDIRKIAPLRDAVKEAETVFHLAAQVAVTSSLNDPVHDFEVNAWGTLNLLEALRALPSPPPLIYTSTNKVFGGMDVLDLEEMPDRYEPADDALRTYGVGEDWGIDFCSPYGCSKGAADQYVLDYARNYGLPATVFRMSCIYGPHQFGTEDQGWVAHFMREAMAGGTLVFYGDGKQVRDVLFVGDLVDAFERAVGAIDRISGQAFNIGGGPTHTVSLIEIVRTIADRFGYQPEIRKDEWRPSDQRYYVSDIRRFGEMTGWKPMTPVEKGLTALHDWLRAGHGGQEIFGEPGAAAQARAS